MINGVSEWYLWLKVLSEMGIRKYTEWPSSTLIVDKVTTFTLTCGDYSVNVRIHINKGISANLWDGHDYITESPVHALAYLREEVSLDDIRNIEEAMSDDD